MCYFSFYAQDPIDDAFKSKVDYILKLKPHSYQYIDSTFKSTNKDTLKMRFLSQKCRVENYLEGESYALNMVGIAYRNISKYNEALTIHKEAQKLANKLITST